MTDPLRDTNQHYAIIQFALFWWIYTVYVMIIFYANYIDLYALSLNTLRSKGYERKFLKLCLNIAINCMTKNLTASGTIFETFKMTLFLISHEFHGDWLKKHLRVSVNVYAWQ